MCQRGKAASGLHGAVAASCDVDEETAELIAHLGARLATLLKDASVDAHALSDLANCNRTKVVNALELASDKIDALVSTIATLTSEVGG